MLWDSSCGQDSGTDETLAPQMMRARPPRHPIKVNNWFRLRWGVECETTLPKVHMSKYP